MADDIVVQDSDDRSERMIRDPKRYFAEARRRAEREVRLEAERRPHRHERAAPQPGDTSSSSSARP